MGGVSLSLQRADEKTIAYVERLLERNGLPSDDVAAKPDCFYIGYDDRERVGIGGIEIYGRDGLLRSVVIEQIAREHGFGTALCEALEREASVDGVETLYLLTTTASEFFATLDYVTIERSAVPEAIQQTTEFTELCPTTATCIKKTL